MAKVISLKQSTRQLLSIISFYTGYSSLLELFKLNNGIRILCYHGISQNPTNHYSVSIKDFTLQMQFLAENYKVISIDHLVSLLHSGQIIPNNTVSISIDDGFQDFYIYGFPVLKKNAIPATVFLPTGYIDNPSSYLIKHKLLQTKFLDWEQVREMSSNGIDFGSHSVSHNSLTQLTRREIQYELAYSKERLESEIGKTINGFAYPYGTFRDIDQKIEELIAETSFSWAVTSISGVNKTGSNRFALRRTMIENEDKLEGFKRAVKGSLDGWIIFQKCGYYLKRGKHQY